MKARWAVRIGTLVAVVLLTLVALDDWRESEEASTPLVWKQQYQSSLFLPLRERSLTLAEVSRTLGEAGLWLVSADGEPRLVSRYSLDSDGQRWQVQAAIELDQQQTAGLVDAQGWQADMADQPISPAVGEALAHHSVARLSLMPEQPLTLLRIAATFGSADWQMPVGGGEAWIYGREGVVVSVANGQAHSIMFGLRQD
ncbi:MAG: hypothetical protein WC953_14570 [Pseudomonas sp.]